MSQPKDQEQEPGEWDWPVTKEHMFGTRARTVDQNVVSLQGEHGEVCLCHCVKQGPQCYRAQESGEAIGKVSGQEVQAQTERSPD